MELSEFSMPLKHATATMTLHSTNPGTSEVTIAMDYQVKYGIVVQLMDIVMIRGSMRSLLGEVLKGLEHHVLTGEVVGRDGVPAAA
ncbi:MAG: hypothetical protein JRI25_14340 [Deltaproteobacteria bacterium]|nr:hypothetical protein [Deltaproteobacteria bacterium]